MYTYIYIYTYDIIIYISNNNLRTILWCFTFEHRVFKVCYGLEISFSPCGSLTPFFLRSLSNCWWIDASNDPALLCFHRSIRLSVYQCVFDVPNLCRQRLLFAWIDATCSAKWCSEMYGQCNVTSCIMPFHANARGCLELMRSHACFVQMHLHEMNANMIQSRTTFTSLLLPQGPRCPSFCRQRLRWNTGAPWSQAAGRLHADVKIASADPRTMQTETSAKCALGWPAIWALGCVGVCVRECWQESLQHCATSTLNDWHDCEVPRYLYKRQRKNIKKHHHPSWVGEFHHWKIRSASAFDFGHTCRSCRDHLGSQPAQPIGNTMWASLVLQPFQSYGGDGDPKWATNGPTRLVMLCDVSVFDRPFKFWGAS